jgi:hypothetical protein
MSDLFDFIAPGIYVRNESDYKILFVMSQLTPLHWAAVEPGETVHVPCGKVFFTISAEFYSERNVPSKMGTAARLGMITMSCALGPAGFLLAGSLSGITSVKTVKQNGVFANGKVVIFKGRAAEDQAQVYELYIDQILDSADQLLSQDLNNVVVDCDN